MVQKEILVNRFTTSKAFFQSVPVLDSPFAKTPAKQHLSAAVQRGEIEKPDVKILYLTAVLSDVLHSLFQPLSCLITCLPEHQRSLAVHGHAAAHHDSAAKIAK